MEITRLEIIIEPWRYPDQPNRILKIRVKRYPGEDVGYEQILPHNDLLSVWDYIWNIAGERIKEIVLKNKE